VAKIAVIAPLDAGLVQFGRGIRNSVQVAVDEANAAGVLPKGWRVELVALDDSSNPDTGEGAARRAADDPAVIGVVGTYNSGVAARVAPVLAAAGIAMVSPGNTDPSLTLGADPAHPSRPRLNYFRMVTSDNVQGPFLARYAFGDLKARRMSVVTETKPVSKGMADAVAAAFAAAGGQVVSTTVVPDGTTDFSGALAGVASLRPDLVFYGGEYAHGAQLTKQAKAAGVTVPVMGSDGLKDDAYITGAGRASEGDLASSIGSPSASIPSARPFLDAYSKAGFTEPPSDFGVYAYDAAKVIVAAAAGTLAGAEQVTPDLRQRIVGRIQSTEMDGASGSVAFDEFGDTRFRVLTVYRVSAGSWTEVKTETLH
jgi:branched-chain amino acid transport system substrate-binding protein